MKKFILIAVSTASLVTIASHAQAIEYPYCGSVAAGRTGIVERCEYTTMEQCRASVSGLAGTCAANWRLAYAPPAERPVRKRNPQRAY